MSFPYPLVSELNIPLDGKLTTHKDPECNCGALPIWHRHTDIGIIPAHIPAHHEILVPGWMSVRELEWLADAASRHDRIVEYGSAFGRSTIAMARRTKGEVLAVDDWKGPRDKVFLTPEQRESLFASFIFNIIGTGCSNKVRVCREDHREHTPTYKADMIFIDGDHSFWGVYSDIGKLLPVLPVGGLLCGHDYEESGGYEGVREAVTEMLPNFQVVPKTTIWYWYKTV